LSISLPGKIRYFLIIFIGSAALFSTGPEPASEFFGEGNAPLTNTVNLTSQIKQVKRTSELTSYHPDKKPTSISSFKPEGIINTDICERQFSRPPPSL